jgi:hypothetical protein
MGAAAGGSQALPPLQIHQVECAAQETIEGGMTLLALIIIALGPLAFVVGLLWPVRPRPYENTHRRRSPHLTRKV